MNWWEWVLVVVYGPTTTITVLAILRVAFQRLWHRVRGPEPRNVELSSES